jgi:hypothetical protein
MFQLYIAFIRPSKEQSNINIYSAFWDPKCLQQMVQLE